MRIFKTISIVSIMLIMGCSGKACLKNEVFLSKIPIQKTIIDYEMKSCDDYPVSRKDAMQSYAFDEAKGFFKKKKENVKINVEGFNTLNCYSEKNNLLWSINYDEILNRHLLPKEIAILPAEKESEIILLFKEYKGYDEGECYVIFIDEKGNFKKSLHLSQFYKEYYNKGYDAEDLGIFLSDGKYYLIIMGGKGLGIFDFEGNNIKWQKLREQPVEVAIIDVKNGNNKYYAMLINYRRLATRSSSLFIYDAKWDLLYEEVLTQGEWIGVKANAKDTSQALIIKVNNVVDCKATGSYEYLRYEFK